MALNCLTIYCISFVQYINNLIIQLSQIKPTRMEISGRKSCTNTKHINEPHCCTYMFLHYQDWSLFQINPAYISLVDPRARNTPQ